MIMGYFVVNLRYTSDNYFRDESTQILFSGKIQSSIFRVKHILFEVA